MNTRYAFTRPSDALRFLQGQKALGEQRHDLGCGFVAAIHSLDGDTVRNAQFVDDGSCCRCTAWRACGFNSPKEIGL